MAKISPVSIKYMVHANFTAEGALEKPDIIGAIFGQTEGLLGADLEMRELQKEGKVDILYNTVATEVLGDDKFVTGVKIKTKEKEKEMQTDGFFLAIGHIPNTKFVEKLIELNDHGYIKTNRRQHTNVPGIFSAGDVQDHIYKQAVTSAGTGCQCALEAEWYLENLKNKGNY